MVVGPIKRLHKARAVLEMDYMHIGLNAGSNYNPYMTSYRIRTKTRGGVFTTAPIDNSQVINVPAGVFPQFPAGLDVIPPQNTKSPGWLMFNRIPAIKMKVVQLDLEDANRVIEAMIHSDVSRMTHAQIKENLEEIMQVFQRGRNLIQQGNDNMQLLSAARKEMI